MSIHLALSTIKMQMKLISNIKSVIYHLGLYYISYTLILFATSKFMAVQFRVRNFVNHTPLEELNNMQIAWAFFGRSYNYNLFLGVSEFIAASLMVFKKTRLIGLILAAGIYTNVVLIDYEYDVVAAAGHATFEYIIVLLLLTPYLKSLKIFFWDNSGHWEKQDKTKYNFTSLLLPIIFIVFFTGWGINSLNNFLLSEDKIIGSYSISNLKLNGNKQNLGAGKYTKAPMLYFEFGNGFVLSSNDSSYNGSYEQKDNRILIKLDKPYNNLKFLDLTLSHDEKTLKGSTDYGKTIEISIARIHKKNK